LAMRKLPDGTTMVPPAVQGAITWHKAHASPHIAAISGA
jgi:hypothetical protein